MGGLIFVRVFGLFGRVFNLCGPILSRASVIYIFYEGLRYVSRFNFSVDGFFDGFFVGI